MSILDGVVCSDLAQTSPLVDQVNRCKFVHTPVGIEAFVPESIARERYGKFYRTFNRIRSTLASDCNEYLPFYRLHDDLMVEILCYLSIFDRHQIAAVSRRFRSIALNTAHLWTFINFGDFPSIPQIDTLLKRAGAAPLHMRVNDQGLHPLRPPSSYQYPPTLPAIPLKPLSPPSDVITTIPRAAVLDAVISQKEAFPQSPTIPYPVGPKLKLAALTMPMPLLRSLRLSTILTHPLHVQSAPTQVTESLFGGQTPLLRHVAVIQCNLNWFDPAFGNLTYLLIRRPNTPPDISLLVLVLRASPALTYLGLESAFAPVKPDTMAPTVELPALQRLYITDKDTQRITFILGHINAPNVLECDFTSADSSWFDSQSPMECSPFSHLRATQEVTLTVTENYTNHSIIECRWSAKHAVRFHHDPTVMNYYPTAATIGRNYEDQMTRPLDTLHGFSILFGQVRSLTLRGSFIATRLSHIFSLFPAIERLSTRYLSPPRIYGVGNGTTIFDILSIAHCPQLRAIDLGTWPEPCPSTLLRWISARAGGEGGCSKLDEVVVTSEKPLPFEARSRIVSMLDRFLWRKFTVPKPSHGLYMYHPSGWYSPPVIPTSVPSPTTEGTTTQLVEDVSWDEDEEWPRVRPPPDPVPPTLPLNSNLSVLDDPTLIYCDRALQQRWDYFGIPGM